MQTCVQCLGIYPINILLINLSTLSCTVHFRDVITFSALYVTSPDLDVVDVTIT